MGMGLASTITLIRILPVYTLKNKRCLDLFVVKVIVGIVKFCRELFQVSAERESPSTLVQFGCNLPGHN
jgi:hypothetical protein